MGIMARKEKQPPMTLDAARDTPAFGLKYTQTGDFGCMPGFPDVHVTEVDGACFEMCPSTVGELHDRYCSGYRITHYLDLDSNWIELKREV